MGEDASTPIAPNPLLADFLFEALRAFPGGPGLTVPEITRTVLAVAATLAAQRYHDVPGDAVNWDIYQRRIVRTLTEDLNRVWSGLQAERADTDIPR